jgi:hypothetical protein
VAGSWRETQEKQQFYSFGAAASSLPAESGSPKTVAQFAAAHLSGRIANRGLLCQAKRLPDAITSLSPNAAPAKRMIRQMRAVGDQIMRRGVGEKSATSIAENG